MILSALARRRFALSAFLLASACSAVTPPPRVTVLKTPPQDRGLREEGTPLKLKRWEIDRRTGLTRGFTVVRSEREWRDLWPTLDAERIPLLPRDLSFSREMLIVSSPTNPNVVESDVRAAVETSEMGLHVYVTQTLPGEACPAKEDKERSPYDIVRVQRVDKEIRFHLDSTRDEPCEALPEPKITCRVNGTTDKFTEKLSVPAGKGVACIAAGEPGPRATFDRTWTWDGLPKGTFAKMAVAKNGTGVSFTPDLFGSYGLRLEVLDDLGRKAAATTKIDVQPPRAGLVLQMAWTKFDPTDDPSTFPRLEMYATTDPAPAPPKKGAPAPKARWGVSKNECSTEEIPPAWCTVKQIGPTIVMEVARDAGKLVRMGVHYTDERVEGQPVVCIRAYRDGAQTAEVCDPAARAAGTWWEPSALDSETGKIAEAAATTATPAPSTPPAPAAPATKAPAPPSATPGAPKSP
jgi:hypothetical protein